MADHTNPPTSSTYVDFLSQLMARIDDSVKMLDSVDTSPTNLPVASVRRNGLNLERWSGTAWAAVARMLSTDNAAALTALGVSAFIRQLLDDADAAAARTTLGAQASDATLTALAAITTAANKLIYATDSDAFSTTDLTAFARTLLDDADAATARATLGLTISTNVQAYDATLAVLAGLALAADKMIYATGVDQVATTALTAFARTLLDDADAATARATLGAAGTGAQQFFGRVTADTLRSNMAWQQSQIQAYCQQGSDSDFASISLHVQDALASPQVGFSAASGGRIGFFSTDGYEIFTVPLAQLANGLMRIVDGVAGSIDKAAALDFLGQSSAINSFSPIVSDANSAVLNGWYTLPPGGSNTPDTTLWWLVSVVAHNGAWCTQYAHAFTADSPQTPTRRYRELNNGVWTQWVSDNIPFTTPFALTLLDDADAAAARTTLGAAALGSFTGANSGNGYRKIPMSAGADLIIQWGSGTGVNITFPVAFASACYAVTASGIDANQVTVNLSGIPSTTGFSVKKYYVNTQLDALAFNWIAVGV